MVKTKKTLFTVVLAVVCLICFACALSLRSTGKAKADGEKLIDVDATTVAGLSYGAVSVDATTGGKLGSGLLVSGTSGFINVPFSISDFKTLTVGNNPYFASVLDYDYENEIVPFFTLVIDSAFLDNGNGYNSIWFAVKTESGTISQFNLTIRKNGANVPPYFFNDRSWSLDDDYAEQYVIRAFVDYANGKLYYCTGLEIGTTRNVADYCTVIDYDFEKSGLFNCSTGYLEFEIGNGMTNGASTVPVNVWVKDLCGERNFNAAIKYESALTGSYGGTLTVPNATISYLGVDYAATKSVTAPNGNPAVIGSTIDQLGNYTVRYSINKGGKIYYKDAVLRIVEPVLVNTDNNAVYEAISIDNTTGQKLGSAYNVSNGAYVFPFSMTTFKTLTVPTTRLKSLFNAEGRDPDMADIVPLATIICRGAGFNSTTTGIDIKIGTDLSNGNIDELNLKLRAAAGGTSVPGLLWDNNYPVDDMYGEQKAIRIYADYTNGKILVTCGLAIDNDDRMTNYLNNRINYDFAATGMFEGETGFITVQCFDYMADGQAANCTAYLKDVCGVEEGLVPTVSASAISGTLGESLVIPAGTVRFLGSDESASVALFDPNGEKIANDATMDKIGTYNVRYSITKGINVFYKDYDVEIGALLPTIENGAYIRLSTDYGLRFKVNVDLDDIDTLESLFTTVSYGARITSTGKSGYLDIAGTIYTDNAGVRSFAFALVGFGSDEELNYSFTCTAYVELDGKRYYLDTTVTRSLTDVAVAARSASEDVEKGFTKQFTDSRNDTFWYLADLSDEHCQLISDIAAKHN